MPDKKFKTFIPCKERQNIQDKGENVVVDENGAVREDVIGLVLNPHHYDARIFCKIYKEGIQVMAHLSTPALRVLLYFLYSMKYTDEVVMKLDTCMAFAGYHNKAYIYKALSELKKADVIRQMGTFRYQINPDMFYKGNRLKQIKKK